MQVVTDFVPRFFPRVAGIFAIPWVRGWYVTEFLPGSNFTGIFFSAGEEEILFSGYPML